MLLLLLVCSPAEADELRAGFLGFSQSSETEWDLTWKIPRESGISAGSRPVLPAQCEFVGDRQKSLVDNAMTVRAKVRCNRQPGNWELGLEGLAPDASDIVVRFAPLSGATQLHRLTSARPIVELQETAAEPPLVSAFFVHGVEHLLAGYDHILLVIALALLLKKPVPVAKTVTAFTVAHSITLAGVTLGYFSLNPRAVEAVIALSIVFVAVELAKGERGSSGLMQRAPWSAAFLIGLLHGFGFAGALGELGLPQEDIGAALLMFNLGIEVGQLLIVAGCLLVFWLILRFKPSLFAPFSKFATVFIGITASFWFFERVIA